MSAPSHFELSVSCNGTHWFTTDPGTGQFWTQKEAQELYKQFKQRFPETEGFEVSLVNWQCSGTELNEGDFIK